jgi:putative tryptophan/tyrosine transport system substrate-binding protein
VKRREFITLLGGAVAAWPLAALAQQSASRVRRIGILMPYARGDAEYEIRVRALREELGKLGWTEGANVQFDERWTGDNIDRVRADAASLLALTPDVVVAIGGRVVPILMRISRAIPIVVPGATDPVATGWVESLARPGGNVTGFAFSELSMFGKGLEMLKRIAPATSRVAFIYNPDNPNTAFLRRAFEAAAGALAIEPIAVPVHGLADIDRALASLADRQKAGAFFPPDVTIQALRGEVVALAGRYRVPAIYSDPAFPKIGGLAYYGADRIDMYRRAAGYVDRILRGEKPAELPFQQATKFQLLINLKTAKALGLELSPTVLALADEVIE